MNPKNSTLLKKAFFVVGILTLGWTAQAQTTGNNTSSDSTHRAPMHRRWTGRPGGDSTNHFRRPGAGGFAGNGVRRGGEFGRPQGRPGFQPDGFARGGFENNRFGRRGFHNAMGIRYTPEQRKQLAAINKDYQQKSADLFKKDNITLKEYKAGLVTLQKERKSKTEALLTQQQKDQLATRRTRMSENMQVMGAARMERLKLRLNLTDDQVAKIKSGEEGFHNQLKAIRENDNLLPQQKREQMKDLMGKNKDIVKSVLTPEQQTKFDEMNRHRMDHRGFPGGRQPRGGERGPRPAHPDGAGPAMEDQAK